MYEGGKIVNAHITRIIRFVGLSIPFLLFIYGLSIRSNIVDSSHYLGDPFFYSLMGVWSLIAAVFVLRAPANKWGSISRLAAYHILGGLYILFVSGFSVAFIAAWILIFFASYITFNIVGLRLSLGFFVLIAVLDAVIHGLNETTIIQNSTVTLTVMLVGLTVITINRVQEVDGAELIRSKAQETLQRDRILTLVNNLADAVLSTDKNGVVRVYNAASLSLLDTNNSLNGLHIDEILTLHDADKKPINLIKTLKKTRGVVVRDDLTLNIEGEVLRLELTYSPIRSNYNNSKKADRQDGYILILRDVTKAKSLEEERDEFISVVSHELRTPITIAEGTISNVQLMMERKDIAESVLKQNIEMAHEQVMFLAKMVNDLSTLSRAERGVADTPEIIDVHNLIDDLYNEYAPQAEKRHLHFNLDLTSHLGQVTASQLYLRELLQNFITNSLKYTKEGSVTLRVSRKKDEITFTVEDTGIGISKSDQAKIFNKFYRSEDYRTRETGGTGLGLYVAMKLAKKIGTKITLLSRLNHGSSFSITLPVKDDVQ